ncbi:MAG TPA: hypothetical protein VMU87_01380 [Stellaceae bacterium]|nr:hypothetical protein [Stellaceae bacterium]
MITNQFKLVDRLGTFAQTVGRQPLNLDVGAVLTDLYLRLRYTITTGANAPIGRQFGQFLQTIQLLKRIEIMINGQDTVWNIQPWLYACRLTMERHGTLIYGMENSINMTANQTTNVDLTLPLHFDLIRGRKRNDCGLDLRGIRAAQLYVTFGGLNDLFGTPGATVTLSNVQLDVEGAYMEQVPAKDRRGNPIIFAVRQLDEINIPIQGANNQFTVDIDQRTGVNLISLDAYFDTVTGGVHAGDDSGLLNGTTFQGDFKLKSGGTYFEISQANFVKARARDEYFNVNAVNGQPTDPAGFPTEITGLYPFDLRYDGKLSTGIPTGALDANLQLLVNENYVAGTTQLYVQRESVRPLAVGP